MRERKLQEDRLGDDGGIVEGEKRGFGGRF